MQSEFKVGDRVRIKTNITGLTNWSLDEAKSRNVHIISIVLSNGDIKIKARPENEYNQMWLEKAERVKIIIVS